MKHTGEEIVVAPEDLVDRLVHDEVLEVGSRVEGRGIQVHRHYFQIIIMRATA